MRQPPSPEIARPRWASASLVALALGAVVLRALPLLRWGPWQAPVDYDEGVYSSAAQLLFHGVLPYRDFVFVHPPGLLYFLGTSSLLPGVDPSQVFVAARFIAILVGAANVWLVGNLAWRWRGPVAGIVAAALYATYPEVVVVERGPFLEPVLNLACLAGATLWLRSPSRGLAWAAGALLGYAVSVKVMGGAFVLAAVAALPSENSRRWMLHLLGAAAASAVICLLPLALAAPSAFIEQTFLFHLRRPPDGLPARLPRLDEMFLGPHPTAGLLGILGLLVAIRAFRRERTARLALVGFALIALSFLATSTYWNQYNAFLAPSQTVLGGAGAAALWDLFKRWGRPAQVALGMALAGAVFVPLRKVVLDGRSHDESLVKLSAYVRKEVPPDACFFAFEPAWTLAAARLPFHAPQCPAVVDTYAAMLLAASRPDVPHAADANAAFQTEASQRPIAPQLERCEYFALGGRGRRQLGREGQSRFFARFKQLGSEEQSGIDLWKRQRPDPP